ncbi:MAG: hypothetical protein RDU59_12225 [Thermodesulfobacteriota bacterium]|nr:hypothetical protein [Thermodesulfobacteriota bacterium]
MIHPDDALAKLKGIREEFQEFCQLKGNVSEADTRAKIVDSILTECLGWPELSIQRERRVHEGYMDYELEVRKKPFIVVEAKKAGIPFVFPIQREQRRSLKLNGSVLTSPEISEAISQVRSYCDSAGIRYAIATNGYAWIVFRAIRDDIGWREGNAIIFPSLEYMIDHFTTFWNLLSFDAVSRGSLDAEFGSPLRASRESHRVSKILFNADLPLPRNRLNTFIQPLVKLVFEDITGENQLETLKSCYVHYETLKVVAHDIDVTITDTIPAFLRREGTEPLFQKKDSAGNFGQMVVDGVNTSVGELCLLLGGIGSGKTTFLKRYQLDVGRETLDKYSIWFYVDFLAAPLIPSELEPFVWQTILEQLRNRYSHLRLEKRKSVKRAYAKEVEALKETGLKPFREGSLEYENKLSENLGKWQSETSAYVPRLLNTCMSRKNKKIVLFIDNVDQLSPEYQAKIFLLAQRITRIIGSLTIIALREESYYVASIQNSFTAYTNRKFHIASPRFLHVINNRIRYSQDILKKASLGSSGSNISQDVQNTRDIYDLLTIVNKSIFSQNRNIVRFIEAICFGNMRRALEMFVMFLTSGATDVDKMLNIFRRDESYFVGFHEFIKSIMLSGRKYYKEEQSPILNVFDCGLYSNSSHFTALRILHLLLSYRSQSSREGQGYIEITKILYSFEEIFDNPEDFIVTLNRLLKSQLVEVNTRSTESVNDASHIRVTSAGWYYHKYLVRSFCYLDLVLQDTPFNSADIANKIKESVYLVDNLYDREEEKIKRVETRFARVNLFLDYLKTEEIKENERFQLNTIDNILTEPIVDSIREQYEKEREWIRKRIRENRERYSDETTLGSLSEDRSLLDNRTITESDDLAAGGLSEK